MSDGWDEVPFTPTWIFHFKLLPQVITELETRLESERIEKQNSEQQLTSISHQLEVLIREKEVIEQENMRMKSQSQTDLDSLTLVFPPLSCYFDHVTLIIDK